jgi:hypothetical protein
MQMLQRLDKITILNSNDHEVRRVRMNQAHPARVTPSWYGDSVGYYEMVCAENPGNFPGQHAALPTANKPDF